MSREDGDKGCWVMELVMRVSKASWGVKILSRWCNGNHLGFTLRPGPAGQESQEVSLGKVMGVSGLA